MGSFVFISNINFQKAQPKAGYRRCGDGGGDRIFLKMCGG